MSRTPPGGRLPGRIAGVSTPLVIAAAVVLAVAIGAAVALALDSNGDAGGGPPTVEATATTMPPATAVPPSPAPSATASPQAATSVPASPTLAVSETWSVDFQRSGGFAGLAQSLRIESSGAATYEDQRAGRSESGSLSSGQLQEVRALIDSGGFFSQASPQEAPCADCFDLSITVTVDGRTHTVEAVDIALDPALRPLVDRLVILLEDGLSQ